MTIANRLMESEVDLIRSTRRKPKKPRLVEFVLPLKGYVKLRKAMLCKFKLSEVQQTQQRTV